MLTIKQILLKTIVSSGPERSVSNFRKHTFFPRAPASLSIFNSSAGLGMIRGFAVPVAMGIICRMVSVYNQLDSQNAHKVNI